MRLLSLVPAACAALSFAGITHAQAIVGSSGLCPASMTAQRYGAAQVRTVDGGTGTGHGQGLHITMDPGRAQHIASADVTVYAYASRGRVAPVQSGAAPGLTRSFHLVSTTPASSAFQAHLWLSGAGAIAWLDVTRLQYAGGASWSAPSGQACRIYPSGFMPLATAP